jgi:hypothetical protein
MSSTYSPDLRIELIGTGDQAGVWGNTTNTNLGTLMENAVAGYTSVSIIASPQALTANDGALDEARFAAIALTTSTAANFTVCIPPNSKLYTFYNASSYTATISNSTVKNGVTLSGGTTVAIPAGKTMSLWSDGTNVAQQTDQLVSPSMSAPTITGVSVAPTATFGTNTTQLATTAFVQAALQALHPVGSIYTSTSSTNPGTAFGFGTWVAYGAGRVLLGAGGGYTAGATGGSADAITVSHTHTASSTFSGSALAGHSHTATDSGHSHGIAYSGTLGFSGGGGYGGTAFGGAVNQSTQSGTANVSISSVSAGTPAGSVSTTVDSAGASGTNANLQPYVVVYMWNRVS